MLFKIYVILSKLFISFLSWHVELAPANQELKDHNSELASLGEGGENGVITPEKSVVFSVLENCLCLIVRQLPQISPALASSTGTVVQNAKCTKKLTEHAATLVLSALKVLVQLPTLCSYAGRLSTLSFVVVVVYSLNVLIN